MKENGYLNDHLRVLDKYVELEETAKSLTRLAIKYNIAKNSKLLDKIINVIDNIAETEFDALKDFISEIEM